VRKLHLVQAQPQPQSPATKARARRKLDDKPAEMLQCLRCGGREITETRIGAILKGGKVTGGTRAWVCTCCLLNGQRVVMA
jgi:hypothetical protein